MSICFKNDTMLQDRTKQPGKDGVVRDIPVFGVVKIRRVNIDRVLKAYSSLTNKCTFLF